MCRFQRQPLYLFRQLFEVYYHRHCTSDTKVTPNFAERLEGTAVRIQHGLATEQQRDALIGLYKTLQIWILVNSAVDREALSKLITLPESSLAVTIITLADVADEVGKSGLY